MKLRIQEVEASKSVGSSFLRMEEMHENNENIFMFVYHRSQAERHAA